MRDLRKRLWEILQVAKPGDRMSAVVDWFLLSLILLNVLAVVLESVRSLALQFPTVFSRLEVFSVAVFSVEYLARVYSCVCDPRFAGGLRGRLRFAARPMALLDLLAIVPFYLPFLGVDLRFMRLFRLFRLLRVAKLGRYLTSLRLLAKVVVEKREDLILAMVAMVFLLLCSSALMYFAENEQQPDKFSSIPTTMWWAVSTVTTVGYGDVYPITSLGKLLAAFVAVSGIAFFALPTAILGAGFMEYLPSRQKISQCPHCGQQIEK